MVTGEAGRNEHGDTLLKCLCDCGVAKAVIWSCLNSGSTRSCGCLHREIIKAVKTTHGMGRSPEYKVWAGMKLRCGNPRDAGYMNYGGRGVVVCDRWINSFENFFADMGPRPTPKHSIERIDNNGNYCPENCRWATRIEQARNKRRTIMLSYLGESKPLRVWCDELGIRPTTVARRIKLGWPAERALTDRIFPNRQQITLDGKSQTLKEWCDEFGIAYSHARSRVRRGKTPQEAIAILRAKTGY